MSIRVCFSIPLPYFPIGLFLRQAGSQYERESQEYILLNFDEKKDALITRLYQI